MSVIFLVGNFQRRDLDIKRMIMVIVHLKNGGGGGGGGGGGWVFEVPAQIRGGGAFFL